MCEHFITGLVHALESLLDINACTTFIATRILVANKINSCLSYSYILQPMYGDVFSWYRNWLIKVSHVCVSLTT